MPISKHSSITRNQTSGLKVKKHGQAQDFMKHTYLLYNAESFQSRLFEASELHDHDEILQ
jgi:hypothetical protein